MDSQKWDISRHPVWNNVSFYKKPAHLARVFLAKKFARFYPDNMFIGITGSVGKTTTKEACMAVLSQKFKTLATRENIDPIFNIPITLLKIRPNIKKVILEMGIEYPGEMEFYLSLVHPATAIVTRIYYAHSQFLGDVEQILNEKGALVRQLPNSGHAILNWDDPYTRKLALDTSAEVVFYGFNSKKCHVYGANARVNIYGTTFELNYGVERVEVNLKLLGEHWVYSALAAAALGIVNGMTLISIKKGLEQLNPLEHRLQLFEGLNGGVVIDDTYNSSPVAVSEALNVLASLPARKRILVLGEMRELGNFSERLHREVARQIYKNKGADIVILGPGDAAFITDELQQLGYLGKVESNQTHSQMVSKVLAAMGKGDIVLVKGSRALKLEEIVKRITKH